MWVTVYLYVLVLVLGVPSSIWSPSPLSSRLLARTQGSHLKALCICSESATTIRPTRGQCTKLLPHCGRMRLPWRGRKTCGTRCGKRPGHRTCCLFWAIKAMLAPIEDLKHAQMLLSQEERQRWELGLGAAGFALGDRADEMRHYLGCRLSASEILAGGDCVALMRLLCFHVCS